MGSILANIEDTLQEGDHAAIVASIIKKITDDAMEYKEYQKKQDKDYGRYTIGAFVRQMLNVITINNLKHDFKLTDEDIQWLLFESGLIVNVCDLASCSPWISFTREFCNDTINTVVETVTGKGFPKTRYIKMYNGIPVIDIKNL